MTDARGGEVVFLAHCLLNQNTRYLGGATCAGAVEPALSEYLRQGTGIVQLPCPEQRVWGRVLKTRLLWLIEHPRIARAAPLFVPVVRAYLRLRYAHLARRVARDIDDYARCGFAVRGIVGVAGSPSCGVHSTLDLRQAAAALAARRQAPTAAWMNTEVVAPAIRPGTGLFIEAIGHRLARRHREVALLEQVLPPDQPPG